MCRILSFDNIDVLRTAGEPHPVRPVAQRSISNRLGSPFPYLCRCPPDVQAMNLNHWVTNKLSMESPIDNPESTFASFSRQFGLNTQEQEAVEWAWPMEMGDNMFAVVNTYTRAAQWDELSTESSFRLSRVGGNILGMLN